jgi:ParB family protein of integrating conjugative element (PFGI_1 class)
VVTQSDSVIEECVDDSGLADTSSNFITKIEVARIRSYVRNPRRQENPEYDRIKASIRAEGLDQPLVVTQEPGEVDYVLQAGGNTRLRILKELHQETEENRFFMVDCLIKPWVHESNLLFAHLRENELRGSLSFIDKAQAVFEAKALLEAEMSVEALSQRHLEKLFQERGFSLSHGMISKMGYVVHTLWPVMPHALNAGLGRPQIEKIRSLERATLQIWQRRNLGDKSSFEMVFAELCRRHDSADWDIQPLRGALENEVAEESEQSIQVIRLEMEAYLAGNNFVAIDTQADKFEDAPQVDDGNEEPPSNFSDSPPLNDGDESTVSKTIGHVVDEPHELSGDTKEGLSPPLSNYNMSQDIDTLRTQMWECALALAERNGMADRVIPLPGQGLGFLLCDVPSAELTETLDEELLGQVSSLWWQLAACSEITVAPVEILLTYLKEDSVLYKALATQDAGLLFESVWTLDPGHIGSQLWQQLSDTDWQQLLAMMALYRSIKRLAQEKGSTLWGSSEGDS